MAKFSGSDLRTRASSGVRTKSDQPDTFTHEGGAGFSRDARSELFLLAVANMVGEDTFYEDARSRDQRFERLVHQVTNEDPDWIRRLVPFLRQKMFMRSASIVAAAEYVRAGGENGRQVVRDAMWRADEPAEMVGYWLSRYGKPIPKPVKRGIADSAVNLYNEYAALKYDGQSRSVRMADVINLSHPAPKAPWQSDLFSWLLDRRYQGADAEAPESLERIRLWEYLNGLPEDERRERLRTHGSEDLENAPITWEWLSGWLPGGMDAEAWEWAIPQMGYMALLRNLRNFDEAGISKATIEYIKKVLGSEEAVAKSRQFPMRFLSAWKAVNSMHWGPVLEEALELSLSNVPGFSGRTLVLWDCSGSMRGGYSNRGSVERWESAGIFALTMAKRSEQADLYAYSYNPLPIDHRGSVLRTLLEVGGRDRTHHTYGSRDNQLWGGTDTFGSLHKTFKGHDRVVIVTDEQAHPGYDSDFLSRIPLIYTFNIAGYRSAQMPQGFTGRYAFGGLSDSAFKAIDAIESASGDNWPF